jgi:hypothetical protein
MTNLILTRYLYNYEGVKRTLVHTILSQHEEPALFWGYELYYSGFHQETAELLQEIYDNFYAEYYPKLGEFIEKCIKIKNDPTIVATIIKNLVIKPIFKKKPESKNPKFVRVKQEQIESYMTKLPKNYLWKYLQEVCKYGLLSEVYQEDILLLWHTNWLYYTSRSPIWKERIICHTGIIDDAQKTIRFDCEDNEEAFYNIYGYEPDEQPAEIYKKCLGLP